MNLISSLKSLLQPAAQDRIYEEPWHRRYLRYGSTIRRWAWRKLMRQHDIQQQQEGSRVTKSYEDD